MSDLTELSSYFDKVPKKRHKGQYPKHSRYLSVLLYQIGLNQIYVCERLKISKKTFGRKLDRPGLFTLDELLILSDITGIALSRILFLCYGFEPRKSVNEQVWHVKGLTLTSFDDLVRIEH